MDVGEDNEAHGGCKWCKWVARARKGFGLRLVNCWAAKFGADFVVTVRVGCWAEKLGALFPLARVPARSPKLCVQARGMYTTRLMPGWL